MDFNLPIYLYEWRAVCPYTDHPVKGELFALDDSHAKIQVVNIILYNSKNLEGKPTEMKALMKTVKVKKLYEWEDEEEEEPVIEEPEKPSKLHYKTLIERNRDAIITRLTERGKAAKISKLDELFNGHFSKHLRFFLKGMSDTLLTDLRGGDHIQSFYNFSKTHYVMRIAYKGNYRVSFSSRDLEDLTDKVYEYFITERRYHEE